MDWRFSSGSGVATAAGLCFGALGTDTGGSIRFPSAACGVVGVKPSFGRVSTAGVFPLAPSLDHLGPMARSVRDAARLLTVLAGPDPADVRSRAYGEEDFEAALATGVAGLRVAFPKELWRAGVASALTEAGAAAAEALAEAGVAVGGAAPPSAAALIDGWALTAGVEAALVHEKPSPPSAGPMARSYRRCWIRDTEPRLRPTPAWSRRGLLTGARSIVTSKRWMRCWCLQCPFAFIARCDGCAGLRRLRRSPHLHRAL